MALYLNQTPPEDDLTELPVNPNITLDDVALDTSSSDDNAQYASSNVNTDAFVFSKTTPPLCDPSSSILPRSRISSRIYSSSDSNSSKSNILGFLTVKHCPERIVVSIVLLIVPKVVQHTPPQPIHIRAPFPVPLFPLWCPTTFFSIQKT